MTGELLHADLLQLLLEDDPRRALSERSRHRSGSQWSSCSTQRRRKRGTGRERTAGRGGGGESGGLGEARWPEQTDAVSRRGAEGLREVECEQAAIAMDGDTDGRRGASCRRRRPLRRSRERSRNQARDQRPEQMLPKIQWTGKTGDVAQWLARAWSTFRGLEIWVIPWFWSALHHHSAPLFSAKRHAAFGTPSCFPRDAFREILSCSPTCRQKRSQC